MKRQRGKRQGPDDQARERIFVDAMVAVYLSGEERPEKTDAWWQTKRLLTDESVVLVTSAEVYEELLNLYTRWMVKKKNITRERWIELVTNAFTTLDTLTQGVKIPITREDVQNAFEIMQQHRKLDARDSTYVALAKRVGIRRMFSFDRAIDSVEGITRIGELQQKGKTPPPSTDRKKKTKKAA